MTGFMNLAIRSSQKCFILTRFLKRWGGAGHMPRGRESTGALKRSLAYSHESSRPFPPPSFFFSLSRDFLSLCRRRPCSAFSTVMELSCFHTSGRSTLRGCADFLQKGLSHDTVKEPSNLHE